MRWGIMSASQISHKFIEAANGIDDERYDIEITAVSSRDAKKLAEFQERYSIKSLYKTYEELAKSPVVDAVYISSTNDMHFAMAKCALENGKHVLIEKPFTINGKEAEALQILAKSKNLFLMEGLWSRFLPAIREAKKLVDSGAIGDVKTVMSTFSFNKATTGSPRLYQMNAGGGGLLDLGCYAYAVSSNFIKGEPVAVKSLWEPNKEGVDIQACIIAQYPTGTINIMQFGIGVQGSIRREMLIYGTTGRITLTSYSACQKLRVTNQLESTLERRDKEYTFNFAVNGFEYEIMDFEDCVEAGKLESDVMPVSTSVNMMKIFDGVRAEWGLRYPTE